MLEPIAYEFSPRLPGYPKLASEVLSERIAAINAASKAEQAKTTRLYAIMVLVALIPVFIVAASVGLSRQEQAYQSTRV